MIAASVGPRRPNRATDVRTVQSLLNRVRNRIKGQEWLREDGIFGPLTAAAINRYQTSILRFGRPDGAVDPGGPTLTMLVRTTSGDPPTRHPAPHPMPRPVTEPKRPAPSPGHGSGVDRHGISNAIYMEMAQQLNCEVAAIKAVVETELWITQPFDKLGRPTILFERHKFRKHTGGKFDKSNPDISYPVWGGYGKPSEQYPKLERAMRLDRTAALKSASWGAFQILGENHKQAGHISVDSFVAAMKSGIVPQARAFIKFVMADRRLLAALRQRNWSVFARIYNGPGYRQNNYDSKMRMNYQRYANGA